MLSIYLNLLETEEEKSKFEQLYLEYRQLMYGIAFGILKDSYLAEDAVQEAFIRIAKNFKKVNEVFWPQTKGFAVIIVRNVSLTMLQKKSEEVIGEEWTDIPDSSSAISETAFTKIAYDDLVGEILSLPLIYKDTLYLNCVQECSVVEIASILNIKSEAVKKRLQRGRTILIENLKERGLI